MGMIFIEDMENDGYLSLPFSEIVPPSLQVFHFHNRSKNKHNLEEIDQETNLLVEYMNHPSTKLKSLTLEHHNEALIQAAEERGIEAKAPMIWHETPFMKQDDDGGWETKFDRFEVR